MHRGISRLTLATVKNVLKSLSGERDGGWDEMWEAHLLGVPGWAWHLPLGHRTLPPITWCVRSSAWLSINLSIRIISKDQRWLAFFVKLLCLGYSCSHGWAMHCARFWLFVLGLIAWMAIVASPSITGEHVSGPGFITQGSTCLHNTNCLDR